MHEEADLLLKLIASSQHLQGDPVVAVTRSDGVWALEKALSHSRRLPGSARGVCLQDIGSFFLV